MGILRIVLLLAVVLFLLSAVFKWAAGGKKKKTEDGGGQGPLRPGAKHSAELRCETHGLTVRLEAEGAEEFERSRVHLRCPLCGMLKN